ncbi:L,D-transpeptidase [Bdellovibrio bacteriovorus]|uniref:L,D-transpeptidase n=1 Tax=Bdellovibrio bacteriovorus TaxID=959 RepID=UPI0035A5E78B
MTKSTTRRLCSAVLSVLIATSPLISQAQALTEQTQSANAAAVGIEKSKLRVGQRYFISADSLNVRSSNATSGNNIVGKLSINDEVEIYDLLNEATPLVQIKIIKSATVKSDVAPELFVSKDYLSEKQLLTAASKYFVIQNVATEITRVYERCTETPNCPHKLVMETEMVVGRPEEGTKQDPHAFKTWLGHSRISEWIKFYQDGMGHYPHWYRAGQDLKTIPKPITDGVSKIVSSRKWMVDDARGEKTIYGAFGWYAAKVTPADETNGMNYQWMHGTIGWGKDGSETIELTRGFFMNLFSNPGSSGCTRLENRAIAYLRSLLPVGTDIYRVYARESTREKEIVSGFFKKKVTPLSRYADKYERPGNWDYILLTNGAQQSGGLTADAKTIIEKAIQVIPDHNLIEAGQYAIDQYPNAMGLNYGRGAASGKSGDRYRIDSGKKEDAYKTNFRGYFLVDEGRFVDYAHPDSRLTKGVIKVSGLADFRTTVPEFLATTGSHNPPEIQYQAEQDNGGPRGN